MLQSAPHTAVVTLRAVPCLQGVTPGVPILTCGPWLEPMGWNITLWKARSAHQPAGTRGRSYTNQLDTKFTDNLINIIIFCSKRCRSKDFLTCRITNSLDKLLFLTEKQTKRKISYILIFTQPPVIELLCRSYLIFLYLFMKHDLLTVSVSTFLFFSDILTV